MKKEKEIKGDKEAQERIWRIRDSIRELEKVKEKIINFLNSEEGLDDSTREMWITDSKDVYYNIVGAWDMLRGVSEGEDRYIDSCRGFLETAKGRLEQSSSELKVFGEGASQLESEFRKTFEACYNAISSELEKVSPKKEFKKPSKRVIKVSDEKYELPCSVCGESAVVFEIGTDDFSDEEGLIFAGITHSKLIGLDHTEKILTWLKKSKISEIHSYVRETKVRPGVNMRIMEDGIDAYCPDCDKIYCEVHYHVKEEWDEGFYDYSTGTCPEGHTREIDD